MRCPRNLRILGVALSLACALAGDQQSLVPDPDRFLDHVRYLSSDDLGGRGAGTPQLEQAAKYIADHFEGLGLEPAGDHDGFFQRLSVTTGAKLGDSNSVELNVVGKTRTWKPGTHYLPINFSDTTTVGGNVVFAGYGIRAAEDHNYDDYAGIDVKDKIVVVLRYEPQSFSKESRRGPRGTSHSLLIRKAVHARNLGAKAIIVVNGSRVRSGRDKLIEFGSVAGPDDAGIVMLHATNLAVDRLIARARSSLETLENKIKNTGEPQSFELPADVRLTIQTDIERTRADVPNVAAYLPGASDEYVVVGAHYDHLGLGGEGSLAPRQKGQVHNGADDNASGTSGVLELASLLSARQSKLRRGVLFLAFAAEEIGLLGSAYWAEHPTLPLDGAVAMLNMDMIGRVKNKKIFVGGTGTGTGFEELLADVAARHDLKLDPSKSGYGASDHTSFVSKQVPVLFFFSGLHSDYHKPSDDWQKVNAESSAELLGLIGDVTLRLAQAEERPEFIRVTRDSNPHASAGDGASTGGYGPWFGSIPDFGEHPDGVKFADITPGSPADAAGLHAGDVLIEFAGKPIKNLYDFTFALRDHKPGDNVTVRVLRDGESIAAEVALAERP